MERIESMLSQAECWALSALDSAQSSLSSTLSATTALFIGRDCDVETPPLFESCNITQADDGKTPATVVSCSI